VSVLRVYRIWGAQCGQSQGMGHMGEVGVALSRLWECGEDLHVRGWGEGCLSRLLLSGLSSLQFTIGSDEEDPSGALAPAQFHVEEECGILCPVPHFADLLQDKGPASLCRQVNVCRRAAALPGSGTLCPG